MKRTPNHKAWVNLIAEFDVHKKCDKCTAEVAMMIANPKKDGWLICPRCGTEEAIPMEDGKLVINDESNLFVGMIDSNSVHDSLEDKTTKELQKKGYSDIRVQRAS